MLESSIHIKITPYLFLVSALLFSLLITFSSPVFSIIVLAFILLTLFFVYHFDYGIYALVLLTPFVYLQLFWRDFNVPVSDLLAMVIFVAWFIRVVFFTDIAVKKLILKSCPAILYFLIFILATTFSFTTSPDVVASVKYLFRPIIFFYLMFVVVPYVSIDNETTLYRVLLVSYWLGVIVSLMGAFSLLSPQNAGILWRRALPVSIFGIYPLGTNHNLIAEVLITIIPLGFFLAAYEKNVIQKKAYIIGNVFMVSICLLTFSRAGWLVLVVQLLIALYLRYRSNVEKLFVITVFFFISLIPLALLMYHFSQTFIVSVSNSNRMLLNQTAFEAWKDNVWIGNGLNTFISFVEQNPEYTLEFGSPLDSHGVIQKLLVEVGVIGALAFLFFICALFVKLFKAYKTNVNAPIYDMFLVSTLAAAGIFIFELFNTSYFIGKMWLPIGVALASAKLVKRRYFEELEEKI